MPPSTHRLRPCCCKTIRTVRGAAPSAETAAAAPAPSTGSSRRWFDLSVRQIERLRQHAVEALAQHVGVLDIRHRRVRHEERPFTGKADRRERIVELHLVPYTVQH